MKLLSGKWEKRNQQRHGLDKFDSYYHHMFLWDNEITYCSAYQMGQGQNFPQYGIDGFYLQDLFRFQTLARYDGKIHRNGTGLYHQGITNSDNAAVFAVKDCPHNLALS